MDWPCQDFIKSWQGQSTFTCVHQENEKAVWAQSSSLRAFKCVDPASGVKWSRIIVVKLLEPSADVIVSAREQGALIYLNHPQSPTITLDHY